MLQCAGKEKRDFFIIEKEGKNYGISYQYTMSTLGRTE